MTDGDLKSPVQPYMLLRIAAEPTAGPLIPGRLGLLLVLD